MPRKRSTGGASRPKKKSDPVPKNKALYARVKAEAKKKYKVWPSADATGWLTKQSPRR